MIGENIYNGKIKTSLISTHLVISLLVLLLLSPCILPQQVDLPFEHFTVDKGMSTVVNYILQDKIGFLWFATNDGLYKYDGYNFTSYKHDIDDSTSLIDNTITMLYQDREGILWLGTWLGLEKFDQTNSSFIHYKPIHSDTSNNAGNKILAICEDKYNTLWVGTDDGLFKFDKETKKFICLKNDSADPGSISNNSVNTIYSDKEGSLWFGTQVGLDKFDFKTGKFKHYLNNSNIPNESWVNSYSMYWNNSILERINSILEDETGIIWLATNGGLVELNPKKGKFYNYCFPANNPMSHVTSISQDVISGNLWLSSWGGLLSFDKETKKYTHYNSEANYVLSERSGTLWIGTNTDIKKLNRKRHQFKKYPINEVACGVAGFGKQDAVWIWTFSGFKKFDINKEKFVPYSFGESNRAYFIYSENEMLVQTAKGGFFVIDTLGNSKQILPDSLKEFNSTGTWTCRTKKGYWIGTANGGFNFIDPITLFITEIRNLKQNINFMIGDRLGSIWISTLMGKVFCYNPEKDSLAEFMSDSKNPSSISGKHVTQIYEDTRGRIWFTTTNGLNKYDRSTNQFTRFTEKDGLGGNNAWGMLEDDHGNLWIITNKGISKFNPNTNRFKNYDDSYGVDPITDIYFGVGYKAKDGEMYFPGAHGFTRFHPDSVKDNPFIPTVVITSFKKLDKPYPFSKQINLPYNENFISFEFAALSYINPERNQYAYKMEGLDKDWVYSGTRRYASYPNLAPGEYVFMVKGSNNDGIWNEAGTSILVIISPPWWKTWWAYSTYATLFIFLLYGLRRYDLNRISLKNQVEMDQAILKEREEIDKMKSRFFANISHEFRTPLTLILGPVKQMIEQSKDEKNRSELKVVHKNANRLHGLVNQLLDLSKLESGNMKLQTSPQNIIPLIKALLQSFCSYAERKRITLKFNSEFDEIIAYIDKDKIEKIFTNVFANALKFTPEGGEVEVTIKATDTIPRRDKIGEKQFLEISICDTGIGIPKEKLSKIFDRFYQVNGSITREQEGTGIGLSLTKELVDLHKGKIEVESNEGTGSNFIIKIPLGKEHLKPEEICEPKREDEKTLKAQEEISYPEKIKIENTDIDLITGSEKSFLLIVEDNPDVRNYIKNNLEKDYKILEAVDGEDGCNKSFEQLPDLIVSDVMMPKMDGFKLCDKLKTDERTSHIPIILLTAKASSQDKIEGFETGADDYIMKPFDTDELKVRIKNLIEQRKRIHEHFRKEGLFEIEKSKITPIDKKFLNRAIEVINQKISDSSFNIELFAENLNISKSLLQKKLVSLTGESPVELIRRIRLKKAIELIENKFGNISEIAFEVGFNNPAYFSESFKRQFGVSPSQYQHKNTSL